MKIVKKAEVLIFVAILAFAAWQWGNLLYMNVRSSDPILMGWEDYDETLFNERLARGETMLVEIYASWCPVCLAQHRAFESLMHAGHGPKVRAIRVDFDRDKSFIQQYEFHATGTLVLFQSGRETTRITGLVTPELITNFLDRHDI